MHKATTSMLMMAAIAFSGCKSSGLLAKREAEKCCPTDIRKTVPWCAGEDALFHCPCEPSAEFYGYKPTCWRTWPTSGASWRDLHCGDQHHKAVITDLTHQNPELIELPTLKPLPVPEPAEDQDLEPDAAEDIDVPSVKIEVEPVPAPPEVPTLKQPPERETPQLKVDPRPAEQSAEQPLATADELSKPLFGPVPLPDISEEYAE